MGDLDRPWRLRMTKICVLLVVVSLLAPFVVGCLRYGNAFVEYVESVSWHALPLMVAGALAGFVSEFMGVWLTRRLDYGLLVGTGVATVVSFFVVLPREMSEIALLSVGGCLLALLVTSIVVSFAPGGGNSLSEQTHSEQTDDRLRPSGRTD